ncbi:hypothetical protein SLA2020_268310 [Shorea laevis]
MCILLVKYWENSLANTFPPHSKPSPNYSTTLLRYTQQEQKTNSPRPRNTPRVRRFYAEHRRLDRRVDCSRQRFLARGLDFDPSLPLGPRRAANCNQVEWRGREIPYELAV